MERKKALIAAGAVSGTLLAASTAFALTGGIVDSGADDGAGSVSPVTASTIEQTLTQVPATPLVGPPATQPVTTSSASAVAGEQDGDDLDDEHEYEDDERDSEDEDHEDEDEAESEYEGAEDDD